ncbi:GNAT family N-acetyltransferase [Pediococcus stilesii]|uniref:Acetyltransferase n=1 Tax=Pediococcus stilesii TaxID=331679 RepID=A0A0R2L4Q4_9LACO|nr:GNAT family N-acetyltransferase [Pediococcus stilesii]KRN93572.1 acetyltransferase [Pediococcus stilesii]TLQ05692.1 GNAT family N-acetyltransferase [Pediococcus stilesii]
MESKLVKGATGPVYLDALEIRKQVFIEEQGIDPALEFDENEDFFTYFVGYDDGRPVVTARARRTDDDVWLVQRVATRSGYRRHGLARDLFEFIEDEAKKAKIKKIRLHAQETAEPFYFAMNYNRISGPEMEAGIVHYWMEKEI